jgi:hypothetical protein
MNAHTVWNYKVQSTPSLHHVGDSTSKNESPNIHMEAK